MGLVCSAQRWSAMDFFRVRLWILADKTASWVQWVNLELTWRHTFTNEAQWMAGNPSPVQWTVVKTLSVFTSDVCYVAQLKRSAQLPASTMS